MPVEFNRELCIKCGQCVKICAMGFLRMTDDGPMPRERASCMECLQCGAVCPRQAVLLNGVPAVENAPEEPVEKLIMSRRSVRHFKPEAPDKKLIEWALQRAGYAPSGKNRHDNRWSVIYGRERVQAVTDRALQHCRETGEAKELLRFAEKGLDLLTCYAPAVILAWSPDDCLNPCVDAAIALETAELLLVSRGLGTCWGGYLRQLAGHCPPLKQMLGVPDGCSIQGCLMVGYPSAKTFRNIPSRPQPDIYWV